MTGVLKFTNFLVALVTPILLAASAYGAYFLFGGLVLGSVIVYALYMPETRGRSLESIQGEFRRPSALSQISSLLQPFGLRRRHPASQSGNTNLELEGHAPAEVATSAISFESAARGLRFDVGAS